jgi:hypothetical protein
LIDFVGVEQIEFRVGANKVGSGTQSWQLWNVTDGAEIGVIDDAGGTGDKILSATFSGASVPSGVKLVRVRAKSTVAADDPVYYGSAVLLRRAAVTFERLGLAEQIIRNAYGLTRDMRDNANGYKAAVTAGQPVNAIAAVMVADAGQYLNRLGWFTSLASQNLTLLTRTLADYATAPAVLASFRDNLISVAEHTQEASLATGGEINTEADFILANVPDYERLW